MVAGGGGGVVVVEGASTLAAGQARACMFALLRCRASHVRVHPRACARPPPSPPLYRQTPVCAWLYALPVVVSAGSATAGCQGGEGC